MGWETLSACMKLAVRPGERDRLMGWIFGCVFRSLNQSPLTSERGESLESAVCCSLAGDLLNFASLPVESRRTGSGAGAEGREEH